MNISLATSTAETWTQTAGAVNITGGTNYQAISYTGVETVAMGATGTGPDTFIITALSKTTVFAVTGGSGYDTLDITLPSTTPPVTYTNTGSSVTFSSGYLPVYYTNVEAENVHY